MKIVRLVPLFTDLKLASKANSFFFDTIKSEFLVYDSTGVIIASFGRMGRGPKEFQLVYGYTIDELGNIYVYDDAQRMIKVFDSSYELLNTIDIDNSLYFISSHDMEVLDSNLVFGIIQTEMINSPDLIDSPPIMITNTNGESSTVIGTYDPFLSEVESNYNRPLFDIDRSSNSIIVSHQNSYRFQEFNLTTGERISYFGVKDESFGIGNVDTNPGQSQQERYLKTISESSNEKVFYTSNFIGNFYINASEAWLDTKDLNDLTYFISVYSRETYELLDVIPNKFRLIGVFNDQLYFIENEDPQNFQVGVYTIVEQ